MMLYFIDLTLLALFHVSPIWLRPVEITPMVTIRGLDFLVSYPLVKDLHGLRTINSWADHLVEIRVIWRIINISHEYRPLFLNIWINRQEKKKKKNNLHLRVDCSTAGLRRESGT